MEIILLKVNYSSFYNALIRVVNDKICGRTIWKKGRFVTYEKLISTVHKRREQVTRVQPAVASAGSPAMICGIVSQGVIRPCQILLEMMFERINSYIALRRHSTDLIGDSRWLAEAGAQTPAFYSSKYENTRTGITTPLSE